MLLIFTNQKNAILLISQVHLRTLAAMFFAVGLQAEHTPTHWRPFY
jgi:hypothetical protein